MSAVLLILSYLLKTTYLPWHFVIPCLIFDFMNLLWLLYTFYDHFFVANTSLDLGEHPSPMSLPLTGDEVLGLGPSNGPNVISPMVIPSAHIETVKDDTNVQSISE